MEIHSSAFFFKRDNGMQADAAERGGSVAKETSWSSLV